MGFRDARMAIREERWRPGKPKKWPSKKDRRPGSQKTGHLGKMAAREAKKLAGNAKRPSGSQKNGRDGKNGRGEAGNQAIA